MGHGPEVAIELQHSESEVLQAASRIYAAHVAAGLVTAGSEESILEHSVRIAVQMALTIDRFVQSDEEVSSLRRRGPA